MTKNKRIRNTLLILLLIPLMFILELNEVEAGRGGGGGGGSVGDSGGGGDGGSSGSGGGSNSGTPAYGSKCDSVSCSVSHSYEVYYEQFADVKKADGTIEDLLMENYSTEFLAGTSIMLKVYEKQNFTTTASYSVSAKRQVWTCKYYNYEEFSCCTEHFMNGECKSTGTCKRIVPAGSSEDDCSCSGSADIVIPTFKGWRDVTSEYIASCSASAVPEVITLEPSYVADYKDSNDIDAKPSNDKYYTAEKIEGHECGKPVKGTKPGKYGSGGYSSANTLSGECDVSYDRIGSVCINVKKGLVRYINEKEKCDTPDEYTITPDEDGYWKYFIPLNANSKEDFQIILDSSNKQKALAVACIDYINKYDDYAYFITDSNGNSFIGQNITKKKAKQMVANGCYFKITITIPVIQRFYNELENGINFKGFNFYYKPIDIDNPFPNGLNNVSLWYDWNKDKKKEPDISESYDEITYYANTSGNEEKIRKYNNQNDKDSRKKDHPYASWQEMNVNGTSNFIKNQGIVASNVSLDSFYPLGCGPWNEDKLNEDGSKNYFYQPECDRK